MRHQAYAKLTAEGSELRPSHAKLKPNCSARAVLSIAKGTSCSSFSFEAPLRGEKIGTPNSTNKT